MDLDVVGLVLLRYCGFSSYFQAFDYALHSTTSLRTFFQRYGLWMISGLPGLLELIFMDCIIWDTRWKRI